MQHAACINSAGVDTSTAQQLTAITLFEWSTKLFNCTQLNATDSRLVVPPKANAPLKSLQHISNITISNKSDLRVREMIELDWSISADLFHVVYTLLVLTNHRIVFFDMYGLRYGPWTMYIFLFISSLILITNC